MKFLSKISLAGIIALLILIAGCDKTKPYDVIVAPPEAHFVGAKNQSYFVVDSLPVYNVIVGTTDVSPTDRVVTYNVTSPTGAVAGTQYTIGTSGTVTIPAGQALANIDVRALTAVYGGGRKDTLIFTLSIPSLKPSTFLDTVKLALSGPCSEAATDLNVLLGNYDNTNELLGGGPYGPYTTSISGVTPTSATTGTIVVENIWDNGWGPISFDVDWTDPLNRTVTVVQQNAIPGSDAGDLNPAYAGMTIAVRPYATSGPGTYSYCSQTITLNMQLGVTGLGYFNVLYQVNMAR
ncbi:MAG: hypothetical protein H7258_13230 [Ferruginibacter sp.]|nr:hypothetical protein [Ferruginibacter sp.]